MDIIQPSTCRRVMIDERKKKQKQFEMRSGKRKTETKKKEYRKGKRETKRIYTIMLALAIFVLYYTFSLWLILMS